MNNQCCSTAKLHVWGFRRLKFGLAVVATVSVLAGEIVFGNIAVAQQTRTAGVLDEIVVTARKREESIQQSPLSITALSGAELDNMSIRDLEDVGRFSPNVMIVEAGQGGGSGLYFIRGIGQQGNADTIRPEPGVAFYIDGVYKSRGQGGMRELLDLERVEVMRGPQGTLFGRNAIGGAINLITKRPTDEFYGNVRVTVGDYDTFNVKGKVNVPLTDDLYVSVAALSSNRDGYFTRLTDGRKLSNVNADHGRVAARWQPSDDLDVNFTADYDRTREDGEGQYLKSVISPAPLMGFHERALIAAGLPTFEMQSREFLGFGHWEGHGQADMRQDGDEWGVTLDIEYAWENVTFTSISAYREIDYDVWFEADATTFSFNEQRNFFTKNKQGSQEFRLAGTLANDKLEWQVGTFFYRDKSWSVFDQELFEDLFPALEAAPFQSVAPPGVEGVDQLCPGPPFCIFGGAGNPANLGFIFGPSLTNTTAGPNENLAESWAVFVHGNYNISDRWAVSAGVRFSSEDKTFTIYERNFQDLGGPFGACLPPYEAASPPICDAKSDTWDSWTPKVSVEFQATPDRLFYASVSRGFKAGGFNADNLLPTYRPETVWAYEIGAKTDWLGDRLRVNAAAFYNDYTDLQLGTFRLNPITGELQGFQANAGEAPIKGAEIEFVALPGDILTLQGSVGYLTNEFKELDPDVTQVNPTSKIPQSPEWNASYSVIFDFPIGGGHLSLRGDGFYRSMVFQRLANVPDLVQEGFTLFNARITYRPESEKWELSAFGTNLGNKEYIAYGAGDGNTSGLALVSPGEPRMWGVSAEYRF
jgi:iron complex outermembrane receptor protein